MIKNTGYQRKFSYLKETLDKFFAEYKLPIKNQKALSRSLVRYSLKLEKINSVKAKFKPYGLREEVAFLKKQYLDASFYLNRELWQSLLLYVQEDKTPTNPHMYADILYILDLLPKKDIGSLKKTPIDPLLSVDSINLDTFKIGSKKKYSLMPYANLKARGLKFVASYDPGGYTMSDLGQDVACEFVRVFNYFPRTSSKNMKEGDDVNISVQKYIESSLNNGVSNMQSYYTRANQRKIANMMRILHKEKRRIKTQIFHNPGDGRLKEDLKKKKKEIKKASDECFNNLMPINYEVNGKMVESPLIGAANHVEENINVKNLLSHVDESTAAFFKIILGYPNKEFDRYAKTKNIDQGHREFVKEAASFFNVDLENLREDGFIRDTLKNH